MQERFRALGIRVQALEFIRWRKDISQKGKPKESRNAPGAYLRVICGGRSRAVSNICWNTMFESGVAVPLK